MKRILIATLGLLLGALVPHAAFAQLGDMSGVVRVSHHWSQSEARPGDQRVLAVVLDLAEGWHINPDPARTAKGLIPTTLEPTDPDQPPPPQVQVGAVQFPAHTVRLNSAGIEAEALEGRVVLYVPVLVKNGAGAGDVTLRMTLTHQACNDRVCLPPRNTQVEATLRVVPATAEAGGDVAPPELFEAFDRTVWAAMLAGQSPVSAVHFDLFGYSFKIDPRGAGFVALLAVAALGGMLLNFTPCVLPVIPIKIMGLAASAGSPAKRVTLGVSMALGVIGFWVAIGACIAFVAGFDAISELFGKVWFTLGVGAIIALMGVAMCGLFTINLPRSVYAISPRHDTIHGSFGFGIMTAVLSTPCTAPFMGSAAAWATTQQAGTTLTTFGTIGAGMAAPYLLLSLMPQLVERVPRTGPGSELIKQVMGLLMLAAASYFVGIGVVSLLAEPGQPASDLYWWPIAFFVALAGGWLAWRVVAIGSAPIKRLVFVPLGLATIFVAGYGAVRLTDDGPIKWVYYTPQRFSQELARGNVVLMDFTAEWCLNCKALERTVLYTDRVVDLLEDGRVVPMKVDLTNQNNVDGWQLLADAGRASIPLLVVYRPDGTEAFKGDFYTVEQVVTAVTEAKQTQQAAVP